MSTVQFDSALFEERVLKLFDNLKNKPELFHNVQAVVAPAGQFPKEFSYLRAGALHSWLFGYELADTIFAFRAPNLVYALASQKKIQILTQLKCENVVLETLVKTKDADENRKAMKDLVSKVGGADAMVGTFPKDGASFTGEFYGLWSEVSTLKEVDVSAGLAETMAVKDKQELMSMKAAARFSAHTLGDYFFGEMTRAIDEEKSVTHGKLSQGIEEAVEEGRIYKKLDWAKHLDVKALECAYPPIVMSGGNYDLKVTAASDTKPLHPHIIIGEVGTRYRAYCANVARTYLIDPTKEQEENYKLLCNLQKELMEKHIRPGVKTNAVYEAAVKYIKEHKPALEANFTKNAGFVTGIIFRESAFLLSPKSDKKLQAGMVVNVAIGFQNLRNTQAPDSRSKTYALFVSDTVVVPQQGAPMEVLTTAASKTFQDISFYFKEEEPKEKPETNGHHVDLTSDGTPQKKKSKSRASEPRRTPGSAERNRERFAGRRPRTRSGNDPGFGEDTMDDRRRQHQRALADQKIKDGRERFQAGEGAKQEKKVAIRKFESYKNPSLLPREVAFERIFVDQKSESIVLPIFGVPTPFHIATLKNVSKSGEEGEMTQLRLNFVAPTTMKGSENLGFGDRDATFVRNMTFRSADSMRINDTYRKIMDLKKYVTKKEAERKEREDIVEQGDLQEIGAGRRPLRLQDVFERPLMEGRRMPGELEIHANGVRYHSPVKGGHKVDILFSNIKHLFFQPCDSELVVIVHFHLRSPVVVNKKKTYDFQVYREATDVQFDETGNRRRRFGRAAGDEDEMREEEEERRRRKQLNNEFQSFAQKISEASRGEVELDSPYRDLGFYGVPQRVNVFLQPTINALVHLSELPFLVVTLAEVEWVHLERIQYGLKHFDMVIVHKDFSKPVTTITAIPMESVESVKEWLDNVDIAFSEGPLNLKWNLIMKTVVDDPAGFFEDGGWGFLLDKPSGGSDGEQEDSSDEESTESEYQPPSDDDSDDESSDFSDSEESSSEGDSSSEGGVSWDELERKAARSDQHREERERTSRPSSAKRPRTNGRPQARPNGVSSPRKRRPSGADMGSRKRR